MTNGHEVGQANVISTSDLIGRRVWIEHPKKNDAEATKKMGKVRACVFHPKEKRCVGFLVKRPDVALMFHRRDLFVAYNGYDEVDGNIVVRDAPGATDKGACKALGVNWDDCVLWVGMPVMCQDGTDFGLVDSVDFDVETGRIVSLKVSRGATANTLLGMRCVPADLIRGFKRGMGAAIVGTDDDFEEPDLGAILVDDAVKQLDVEGGLAEKAGAGAAVAADAAHRAIDAAKPKVSEAAAAAGEAVNKGAYATGRQLKRATGMFSDFKAEFDRASGGDTASGGAALTGAAASDGAAAAVGPTSLALDEEAEYVFVDEDGNEIEFVDEDGNVITDPALIGDDFVVEDISSHDGHKSAAQLNESATQRAASAASDHLKKAGGMFSAFKEEYDRARKG